MYRTTFFALVIVCGLSAAASANPIISVAPSPPGWKILFTSGQSIDLNTGQPMAVMIETAGLPNQIAGVQLALTSGPDGVTPLSGPLIESVDLVSPGTLFGPNNVGQTDLITLPALQAYSFTVTASGVFDATGPAVLAYLSFDATGVNPGTYSISLTNLAAPGFSTDVFDTFGASLSPTLLDGTVTMAPSLPMEGTTYGMLTVVAPEPGSIVLALFAAGGFCAAAISRRRRRARPACRP